MRDRSDGRSLRIQDLAHAGRFAGFLELLLRNLPSILLLVCVTTVSRRHCKSFMGVRPACSATNNVDGFGCVVGNDGDVKVGEAVGRRPASLFAIAEI